MRLENNWGSTFQKLQYAKNYYNFCEQAKKILEFQYVTFQKLQHIKNNYNFCENAKKILDFQYVKLLQFTRIS